ncbi:MAG: hypothetical protein QOJ26_1767, partial [Thermoplasmata archaeon]|nr:hypothetical protein [Thermoplasmata archaeon]
MTSGGRLIPVVGILCIAALALAGCSSRPELPPIFEIQALSHWREGEFEVVRLTFKNAAGFVPGENSMDPLFEVDLIPMRPQSVHLDGSQIDKIAARYGNEQKIDFPMSPTSGPAWQPRYTQFKAADGRYHGPSVYPHVRLEPGQSLTGEFALHVDQEYAGAQGLYSIYVQLRATYPPDVADGRVNDPTEYFSGCFNNDTPEFYGLGDDSLACGHWDCTGDFTTAGYS